MMFRVQIAFVLCFLCTAGFSFAADLPSFDVKTTPIHHKKPVQPKKPVIIKETALHTKKAAPKVQLVDLLPVETKAPVAIAQVPIVKVPKPMTAKPLHDLTWVLGLMAANADGGKREGSASATANFVVDKPGMACGPEMVIELQGHLVKTLQSTARLDVQIGKTKKTIRWNADEISSGSFKITLNEKIPVGILPNFIPVTALAFVTQTGVGHAAMVSLEKIVLRFPGQQVISSK
jgi:hypothetical protein